MPANFAWVRAKEGRRPMDPVRRDRLERGEWRKVEHSAYWQRLAADGDVELRRDDPAAEAPAEGEEAAPAAAEEGSSAARRRSGSTGTTGATGSTGATGPAPHSSEG